ncbi:MAG: accessory Sec system translocase SecA2 [bacterium]|nr:accessory Sec system translocase SecA2 [bacterium]
MQSRLSLSWQRWSNNRKLVPFLESADAIAARGAAISGRADSELRESVDALRRAARADVTAAGLEEDFEVEVFSLVREAAQRSLSQRPFDVQILAGLVMARGQLAEMATGEGKTLSAVAPACLLALRCRGVHILTFNDYLARRDAEWMGPIYRMLGFSVGFIEAGMSPAARREAYACDVTYLTAKEAGFDRLRDSLVLAPTSRVQRPLSAALVDDSDSILIEAARIPLVLAGRTETEAIEAIEIADVVRGLKPEQHYEIDEYGRNAQLTDAGQEHIEARLELEDLYAESNLGLLADIRNALHAAALLERDVDYIVRDNRVELVDELTGRVAEDRLWPDGLQGAIEAKEGVHLQPEGRILGSITMQHFVRDYDHLCAMTATAVSAAEEFEEFYGLSVTVIPPHRPCLRIDLPDRVFATRVRKREAVVAELLEQNALGRPVLVGTESIAESESLSRNLRERGISCAVLNAKNDAREAEIVADAGRPGAVTISTNMAGRGTDIRLGGADEQDRDAVVAAGGLHVLATNRHESRRIDDQLRGRAARQGDPGSSRSMLSLEDDLVQRFAILSRTTSLPPEHPRVGRVIAQAQRIVEGQNLEIRKTLHQYSFTIEEQRRNIQAWREAVLQREAASFLEQACKERTASAIARLGADTLHRIQDQIVLRTIDRCWSDHLEAISNIRREIHLVRYAGQSPLNAFLHRAAGAFERLLEAIEAESIRVFETLEIAADGAVDWEGAGLIAPSSTWTYTINDEVTESNLIRGLADNPAVMLVAAPMIPLLLVYGIWQRLRRLGRKA